MQCDYPTFEKNISRFHMLRRFVTTNRRIRASSDFWRNLAQFPHLPEGEESNHGIVKLHHTPSPTRRNVPTSCPFAGSEI